MDLPQAEKTTDGNAEVDALFQSTQRTDGFRESEYDLYVPLAVQIEDTRWNVLSEPTTIETTEVETDEGEVLIPVGRDGDDRSWVARVKRIMKMDPETNIISKKAALAMSKATVWFWMDDEDRLFSSISWEGNSTIA